MTVGNYPISVLSPGGVTGRPKWLATENAQLYNRLQ